MIRILNINDLPQSLRTDSNIKYFNDVNSNTTDKVLYVPVIVGGVWKDGAMKQINNPNYKH
jgi:hypothetical protein